MLILKKINEILLILNLVVMTSWTTLTCVATSSGNPRSAIVCCSCDGGGVQQYVICDVICGDVIFMTLFVKNCCDLFCIWHRKSYYLSTFGDGVFGRALL